MHYRLTVNKDAQDKKELTTQYPEIMKQKSS